MAARSKVTVQDYPRIQDHESKQYGLLDQVELAQHTRRVPIDELPHLILAAIKNANKKSSREMLSIPPNATEQQRIDILLKMGRDLFRACFES